MQGAKSITLLKNRLPVVARAAKSQERKRIVQFALDVVSDVDMSIFSNVKRRREKFSKHFGAGKSINPVRWKRGRSEMDQMSMTMV
jgi:hypothetical protein